jgi:nucleotide-binding universal stress UspA family protein
MAAVPVLLVPVDGSERSMRTVVYLGGILSPRNVNIELFHVLPAAPETFYDLGETDEEAGYQAEIGKWKSSRLSEINRFMEKVRTTLMEAGFSSAGITVSVAPSKVGIARDIIDKANHGYAGVVVGRSGFGSLPEYMLGSIAAKLADSLSHVPLAIVGGQPEPRKVIVAMDRSRNIRKGMEQVAGLFSRSLEEILLCHIVRPLSMPHPARTSYFTDRNDAHWLDANSRTIVPVLVNAKQDLMRMGFDAGSFRTAIIKEKTSRAEGILQQADTQRMDTVIIGRRGMTSVERFAMGRVTQKVL